MANYTPNLNLEKPLQTENYDVDVFNDNFDKIDTFAGQVPARALTSDKFTTGAKINGVNFKGDNDVVTGLGLFSTTVTYSQDDLAYKIVDGETIIKRSLVDENVGDNFDNSAYWKEITGQWQFVEVTVSTAILGGTHTHDLSGTIPADGYRYEAIFRTTIGRMDNKNNNTNYDIKQGSKTWFHQSIQGGTTAADEVYEGSQFTVIFPTNSRSISDVISGAEDLSKQNLYLIAYRRLGI